MVYRINIHPPSRKKSLRFRKINIFHCFIYPECCSGSCYFFSLLAYCCSNAQTKIFVCKVISFFALKVIVSLMIPLPDEPVEYSTQSAGIMFSSSLLSTYCSIFQSTVNPFRSLPDSSAGTTVRDNGFAFSP